MVSVAPKELVPMGNFATQMDALINVQRMQPVVHLEMEVEHKETVRQMSFAIVICHALPNVQNRLMVVHQVMALEVLKEIVQVVNVATQVELVQVLVCCIKKSIDVKYLELARVHIV